MSKNPAYMSASGIRHVEAGIRYPALGTRHPDAGTLYLMMSEKKRAMYPYSRLR